MTIRAFAMIDLEIEESHQIRTCNVCRADIGHLRSNAKYCSIRCQQVGPLVRERHCLICSGDLSHRPSWAKYCSKPKECAQIAQRRQNLERMKDPKYRAKAREYFSPNPPKDGLGDSP